MPSSSIEEMPFTCSLDDRCYRLYMEKIPKFVNPLGAV